MMTTTEGEMTASHFHPLAALHTRRLESLEHRSTPRSSRYPASAP